jgi:lipopolysaccharide transport system permease protein
VKLVLMAGVMMIFQYNFLQVNFLLFPVAIISLVMAGMAIGLLLTPIGILYNDIAKGLPILMQFLMYLSPVVFALPHEGPIAKLTLYNPLTPLVVTSRAWLSGNSTFLLSEFFFVNIGLAILFLFAWILFRVAVPMLIEKISS